jgi:UPF0755 protein
MDVSSVVQNFVKKIKSDKDYQVVTATLLVAFIFLTSSIFYKLALSAPSTFPINSIVKIEQGDTADGVASELRERDIIRSGKAFVFAAKLTGKEKAIKPGSYFFDSPISAIEIIKRFARADFGAEPLRVVIPEGISIEVTAKVLNREPFIRFNKEEFVKLAEGKEGYLFPDTYFFSPAADAAEIIQTMSDNFERKTLALQNETASTTYTFSEIMVMASLIEKEASSTEDRRTISGVLWKRIKDGMRLQVDAVFPYLIGKSSLELTKKDLTLDSPYNTYRYEGLPPAPICNPSLDSISAALNPAETSAWYYLADNDGITHFSDTFDEHKIKKARYLR